MTRDRCALSAQRAGAALFTAALTLSFHVPEFNVRRALEIVALVALLFEVGLVTLLRRAWTMLGDPRARSAVFFGLVVTAGTVAFDPAVYLSFEAPKNYVVPAASALALLVWALGLLKRPAAVRITWIEVLLIVALAWGFVSNPQWLASADLAWIRVTIALILLTFVTRQFFGAPAERVNRADRAERFRVLAAGDLFNALWINGVALALLGFRQAFAAGVFRYDSGLLKTPMLSTIGIANGYGAFMTAGVIAALATAASTRSKYHRALLVGAAMLQFAAVLGNGSRGALLGLLAAALLTGWSTLAVARAHRIATLPRRMQRVLPALAAGCIVVALAVGILSLHRLNPASGRGRLMAWNVSARMAADHPARGIGAGRFALEYMPYQAQLWRDPDRARFAYQAANQRQPLSEPLHLLAERGIPGVILYALLWGTALLYLLRALRAPGPHAADRGLLALLVALLSHAFVDNVLHWTPTALAAHLALGLVPARALRSLPLGRGAARALAVTAVVYVALIGIRTAREYPGYRLWRQGRMAGGDASVATLRRARAHIPHEGRLDLQLGEALLKAGHPEEATRHLEVALDRLDHVDIRLELADAYLELGQVAQAERHARVALESFPDRLRPQLLLARVHIAAGRHDEARSALTRCILRLTHFGTSAVDAVASEAHEIWRAHYDDEPPR